MSEYAINPPRWFVLTWDQLGFRRRVYLRLALILASGFAMALAIPTSAPAGFLLLCACAWMLPVIGLWMQLRADRKIGSYGWSRRFDQCTRTFETTAGYYVALHYARPVAKSIHPSDLLQWCERELRQLELQFGFLLGYRLRIFLFDSRADLCAIGGPSFRGRAYPWAWAVVLSAESNLQEAIRHEMVHMLAYCWNAHATPLIREGLAVYLQRTEAGIPIDDIVWCRLWKSGLHLADMVKPSVFHDNAHEYACYMLAGSFREFLIQRFGWTVISSFIEGRSPTSFSGRSRKSSA